MDLLSIMKNYENFKELRKKELAYKSALKRKLTEIKEAMEELEKLLPKTHPHETQAEKAKLISKAKTRYDLESEIEDIQRKLAMLE